MDTNKECNLNLPQPYIDRIIMWNEERELLSTFNVETEYAMLMEEYKELQEALLAGNTYETIDAILDICVVFVGSCFKATLCGANIQTTLPAYKLFATIVETAFEEIRKLQYEPNCCFNECLLEIESRVGSINNTTGKWEKDKSPRAQMSWYKANYKLCRLQ